MVNFIEWCNSNKLEIPVFEAKAVASGKAAKAPTKGAEKSKYKDKVSGNNHEFKDELDDYKGHIANNGTVEPFEIKKGKSKKK
jgi:hypothetical protein